MFKNVKYKGRGILEYAIDDDDSPRSSTRFPLQPAVSSLTAQLASQPPDIIGVMGRKQVWHHVRETELGCSGGCCECTSLLMDIENEREVNGYESLGILKNTSYPTAVSRSNVGT